jgi:hypothetical protein
MDRRAIGRSRHQSVENVDLTDKMSLADTADRGIARHLPSVFAAKREQSHARAATGRGSRSLAPGMAGADYEYVVH